MKTCTKCGEEKPLAEFHRRKVSKDGFSYRCKACNSRSGRRNYDANRERYLKQSKAWAEGNQEKRREYSRKWESKNRFACILSRSRVAAKKRGHEPCNATVEELAAAYTGKCHACGVPEIECTLKLAMDHNHATGEFRGFLCGNCNTALGLLADSPGRALALAEYAERSTVSVF